MQGGPVRLENPFLYGLELALVVDRDALLLRLFRQVEVDFRDRLDS